MTRLVSETGASLAGIRTSDTQQIYRFNRPDGPIGGGWTDAYSLYPTMFDQTVIVGEQLVLQASHTDTWGPSTLLVGHYMVARDLGYDETTDWEVSIRWDATAGDSYIQQAAPCAFIDLASSDPLQMGVLPTWDVSLGGIYIQNAFRQTPIGDVFDPDYYDSLGGGHGFDAIQGTMMDVGLRCVGGQVQQRWNGVGYASFITLPAWAEGRTWFGIHVVAISQEPDIDPAVVPSFSFRLL